MKGFLSVDYGLLNSKGEETLESRINLLLASGVDEITVRPVLMTKGFEYEQLVKRLEQFKKSFKNVEILSPVLGDRNSTEAFADLLVKEIGFDSEKEYVLVGHGSKNGENQEYALLSEILHSKGFKNVEVAVLAGKGNVHDYITKLSEKNGAKGRTVSVHPLLISAGHHIKNDIFGEPGNQCSSHGKSFVQILLENGFAVERNEVSLKQLKSFKENYLNEKQNF